MRGELDKALAYVEQALSEAPDQPLCLSERDIILLQSGRIEAALADLRSAVELQPDSVGLWLSIAVELRWSGQAVVACDMPREAFRSDPTNESVIQSLQECP
jgi:tetratricopeptide (TPR) repeat protein